MGALQNVIRELGKEVCRFTGGGIQDQIPRESDIVLIVFGISRAGNQNSFFIFVNPNDVQDTNKFRYLYTENSNVIAP